MKDTKHIPKGSYCYDDNGDCPYRRHDNRYSSNLYGFGQVKSVWCDYLHINSAQLDFEGVYEKNGAKLLYGTFAK